MNKKQLREDAAMLTYGMWAFNLFVGPGWWINEHFQVFPGLSGFPPGVGIGWAFVLLIVSIVYAMVSIVFLGSVKFSVDSPVPPGPTFVKSTPDLTVPLTWWVVWILELREAIRLRRWESLEEKKHKEI